MKKNEKLARETEDRVKGEMFWVKRVKHKPRKYAEIWRPKNKEKWSFIRTGSAKKWKAGRTDDTEILKLIEEDQLQIMVDLFNIIYRTCQHSTAWFIGSLANLTQ